MDSLGKVEGGAVRVLQWNILADGLAQHGDFVAVEKNVLEWESRGPRILEEIKKADADLICLQEVNHYEDFLLPHLRESGYSGLFLPKDSSPALAYGYPPDGCALFIRERRFHLREHEQVAYTGPDGKKMSQGALICRLEDATSGTPLILATTHLKAKKGPANDAVRLMQAGQLLERLSEVAGKWGGAVVLCGDLNAPPMSDACTLLRSHRTRLRSAFAAACTCHATEAGATSLPHGAGAELAVCQLASDAGPGCEPAFTTWKYRTSGESKQTIDYVWYGESLGDKVGHKLALSKRRQLLGEEEIGKSGLPTTNMPSDHLPLVCEFKWVIDAPTEFRD